jgi:hypothetical protein
MIYVVLIKKIINEVKKYGTIISLKLLCRFKYICNWLFAIYEKWYYIVYCEDLKSPHIYAKM